MALAVFVLLSLVALPGSVSADPACPLGLTASAPQSPEGGVPFVICSGRIPSFDGTPLDTDLTIPLSASGALPLMVMLHGWGGSKSDWESSTLEGNGADRWHWNNAWFAAQGFAVLNYTARGFHRSCGKDQATGYVYLTDPACTSQPGEASWTHLADRRWEIRDTQYLVGLLVDAGVAEPRTVVATGGSYGGGQSWLLALSDDRVTMPDGSLVPWASPDGVPIRLAAAVPKYPWTDLVQALVDNGRASDGAHGSPPDGDHLSPIGVKKESYVDGLFALGETTAQYAVADPTADLNGWFAAVSAGEPYEASPEAAAAVQQLRDFRSPYYLPVPSVRPPVFDIQGLTDPLFPAIQGVQLAQRLAAARYPVWLFAGDLGHSYAANPTDVWQLANAQANAWLADVLGGRRPAQPRDTVETVTCRADQQARVITAPSWGRLATSRFHFAGDGSRTTSSATPPGQEAAAADPIANHGCRTIAAQSDPGVAAWTFSPNRPATLAGSPVVSVTADLSGADAVLAARLWDVDPVAGTQTLVTRSVYRVSGPPPTSTQQLTFELWPAGWQILPGHQVKLELTQDDAPTWRPDNLPSSVTLSNLLLSLPATP